MGRVFEMAKNTKIPFAWLLNNFQPQKYLFFTYLNYFNAILLALE